MKKKFADELNRVPEDGERKILEEIGNHNRGTTFLNANHLISDQLVIAFDAASSGLKEWYFGRFDVRTPTYDDMLKGNFKVLEVNGANSEPTHIYDPHMSIFTAYRDLFAHWNVIYKISIANRKRGFKPDKAGDVWQVIREHLKEKKEHPNKM